MKTLILAYIGKAKNLNPENYIISGKCKNETQKKGE